MKAAGSPDFDLIARPYRWLEYLTFGRALERCRLHHLPLIADCRSALVLGDGDGRFLARALAQNPGLHATAVDTSAAMLRLLRHRCLSAMDRLETHHADALVFVPTLSYDLVATHFFLDCLTQSEVDALISGIAPRLQPGALWLVSDFRIPCGWMRGPARVLVGLLYAAFRLLTGLRTAKLPDHAAALNACGFERQAERHSHAGLLTAELWQRPQPAAYTRPMVQIPHSVKAKPLPDPIPDPEPASPSLPEPDPGVFHHDPSGAPVQTPITPKQ